MNTLADSLRLVAIIEASILGGLLIAMLWRAILLARQQLKAGIQFDNLSPLNLGLIVGSYCLYLFGSILRTTNELGGPFSPGILINPVAGLLGIVGMWTLINYQSQVIKEIETVLQEANK